MYVSTADPRESSSIPNDVQMAAAERSEARAVRNYAKADALHKKIVDSGYRLGIYIPLKIISFSRSIASLLVKLTKTLHFSIQGNKFSKQRGDPCSKISHSTQVTFLFLNKYN